MVLESHSFSMAGSIPISIFRLLVLHRLLCRKLLYANRLGTWDVADKALLQQRPGLRQPGPASAFFEMLICPANVTLPITYNGRAAMRQTGYDRLILDIATRVFPCILIQCRPP